MVSRSLVFSSPDSLQRSPSPAPLSGPRGRSLSFEHISAGMAGIPALGFHGETASEVNLRLHPSDEGVLPGALFLIFCTGQKRPVARTLVLPIRSICPIPSVPHLPEMPRSSHPTGKWSSPLCACEVQVSHYIKSFDHLFEVWVEVKTRIRFLSSKIIIPKRPCIYLLFSPKLTTIVTFLFWLYPNKCILPSWHFRWIC